MAQRSGRGGPAALVTALALMVAMAAGGIAGAQGAWTAPVSEKTRKNPFSADRKALDLGEKLARVNCEPCHGLRFKGDGPAAMALNPKPADWTSARVQGQTDGELFWKISMGRGAMPSWKHLREDERWAIIRFIRSLGGS